MTACAGAGSVDSSQPTESEFTQAAESEFQRAVEELDLGRGDLEVISTRELERLVAEGFRLYDEPLYREVDLMYSALLLQHGASEPPDAGTSCSFASDVQVAAGPATATGTIHSFVERARDDTTCRRVLEVGATTIEAFEQQVVPLTGEHDGATPVLVTPEPAATEPTASTPSPR